MGRLIKEMTNETLKLNPSDVANPDGIKNYYKRIKNVMEKGRKIRNYPIRQETSQRAWNQ